MKSLCSQTRNALQINDVDNKQLIKNSAIIDTVKENAEALVVATKEIGLEVKADKN
jgi:hypothetical protein